MAGHGVPLARRFFRNQHEPFDAFLMRPRPMMYALIFP